MHDPCPLGRVGNLHAATVVAGGVWLEHEKVMPILISLELGYLEPSESVLSVRT